MDPIARLALLPSIGQVAGRLMLHLPSLPFSPSSAGFAIYKEHGPHLPQQWLRTTEPPQISDTPSKNLPEVTALCLLPEQLSLLQSLILRAPYNFTYLFQNGQTAQNSKPQTRATASIWMCQMWFPEVLYKRHCCLDGGGALHTMLTAS